MFKMVFKKSLIFEKINCGRGSKSSVSGLRLTDNTKNNLELDSAGVTRKLIPS